jgi:hypothetical protein
MTQFIWPWRLLLGVIAVALLGSTLEVHAVCNGNRCSGEVQRVVVNATAAPGGLVYVGTDGNERSLNCTPARNQFLVLRPNQALFREMYELLLKALDDEFDDDAVMITIAPGSSPCRILSVSIADVDDD